jgi:hypothetical protein
MLYLHLLPNKIADPAAMLSVSPSSFTVGFNLPLPEFSFSMPWEVGAFVGPRMVERSEEKKHK